MGKGKVLAFRRPRKPSREEGCRPGEGPDPLCRGHYAVDACIAEVDELGGCIGPDDFVDGRIGLHVEEHGAGLFLQASIFDSLHDHVEETQIYFGLTNEFVKELRDILTEYLEKDAK